MKYFRHFLMLGLFSIILLTQLSYGGITGKISGFVVDKQNGEPLVGVNVILNNTFFCHASMEKGHELMLDYLKVQPVINLGMHLGEGSGVAVAYPIIEAAVAFLNEMASFKDAGVSNK